MLPGNWFKLFDMIMELLDLGQAETADRLVAMGRGGRLFRAKDLGGRYVVEVILAIYKAAETGRTIELPLKSDPVLKARKR